MMRETYLSVLALLALSTRVSCSESVGKDGFNYYKDYLRGRSDEAMPGPVGPDRMLYFYRTPLQLYPGLLPAVLEQEYRKRTGNAFKNHMLNKDKWDEAVAANKRSSKTALSQMMGSKYQPYQTKENSSDDFIEIPIE